MTNVTIVIPDDLTSFLTRTVEAGTVAGPSELVALALYGFRDQFELERIKESRLRHDIGIGVGQLECGKIAPFNQESFLKSMRSKSASDVI